MPRRVKLRAVSPEEAEQVRRLAASRTQPFRIVQRARLIGAMLDNPKLSAAQASLGAGYKSRVPGPMWVKRFNEHGLDGLFDEPRSGRPPTHDESVRSRLIDLALHKPSCLGYPFELWTLERLQRAFEERERIHLSDSTIWEWLDGEHMKLKRQQSWFHDPERHDPEFVEKRGP